MNTLISLGKRIHYLRKQRGLSQEDLALECDINRNYLSDLERGRRNPTLVVMERIAIAFDIPLSELTKGIASF